MKGTAAAQGSRENAGMVTTPAAYARNPDPHFPLDPVLERPKKTIFRQNGVKKIMGI